jgi:hypothetical protein
MKSFIHNGHIGDIIAFLPTMRHLGGGRLVVTDEAWPGEHSMRGFKFESLRPLAEAQDYVESCEISGPTGGGDHDVRGFRRHLSGHHSLLEEQAEELGQPAITSKWLHVNPDDRFKGRVIVCRSPRYRNYYFPWKVVLRRLGDRAIFIGTDREHHDMQMEACRPIERVNFENCLQIARAIEASDLFIGNQSSPFWIAAGLNHRLLQETDYTQPNSIVRYNGAHYTTTGNINFNQLGI